MWRIFPADATDSQKSFALPLEISWNDAVDKLEYLQCGLRLPSEAEWEYACRAGTQTRYCFGDDPKDLPEFAWFAGNSNRQTQAVAQLKPNAFGLHDVHGNVGEWCQDSWRSNYEIGPTDHRPHHNPDSSLRALRGGNILCSAAACRSAIRGLQDANRYKAGLRMVRSLD